MVLTILYKFFIQTPFISLYANGPKIDMAFMRIGFYGGKRIESICADMTGVPEIHWNMEKQACSKIIADRVDSWILFIGIIFYVYFITRILLICISSIPAASYRIGAAFWKLSLPLISPIFLPPSASANGKTKTNQ